MVDTAEARHTALAGHRGQVAHKAQAAHTASVVDRMELAAVVDKHRQDSHTVLADRLVVDSIQQLVVPGCIQERLHMGSGPAADTLRMVVEQARSAVADSTE